MVLDPDLADLWALILDFTARVIDVLGGVKFEYSVGWCAAHSILAFLGLGEAPDTFILRYPVPYLGFDGLTSA